MKDKLANIYNNINSNFLTFARPSFKKVLENDALDEVLAEFLADTNQSRKNKSHKKNTLSGSDYFQNDSLDEMESGELFKYIEKRFTVLRDTVSRYKFYMDEIEHFLDDRKLGS